MLDFSIWSYVALAVWIGIVVFLFVDERLRYKHKPHLWARRHEGMISLSDNQRYWCYVLWPAIAFAFIAVVLFAWAVRIFDYYTDTKYNNRYPNLVNLAEVQFPTNIRGNVWAENVHHTDHTFVAGPSGKYFPARSHGYASLRHRIRCAWLVFTGKADALVWPDNQ